MFLVVMYLLPLSFIVLFDSSHWWVAKVLSASFLFSNNQLFVSLVFTVIWWFISALIFVTSVLLLTLDFSGSLRCKLNCLFKLFLFLNVGVYYYELPSSNCFCYIPYALVCCIFISICFKIYFAFSFHFFFDSLIIQEYIMTSPHICEFSRFLLAEEIY